MQSKSRDVPAERHYFFWPTLGSPERRVASQRRIGTDSDGIGKFVTDNAAWSHVGLALDGRLARPQDWQENLGGTVTWRWTLAPDALGRTRVFYHSCHTGCVEHARWAGRPGGTAEEAKPLQRTKLSVVSANPRRNWHGRSGWDVEVTFATLADD